MNEIFKLKENRGLVQERYKLNLELLKWNQVTFWGRSLKVIGAKTWNNLPYHIKWSQNLKIFNSKIKNYASLLNCLVYDMWYISF